MPSDFQSDMESANVSALWERTDRDSVQVSEAPHLWPWAELDPLLDAAVHETDMDNAERRVLVLENPAYRGTHRIGASLNMVVNLQVIMPGETARPHRHRLNALRFIIEGDGGAVTTVDGVPVPMLPGDFLLTPGWCWHEHEHGGKGRAVWLDALDAQLQRHLCTNEAEMGPSNDMPPPRPHSAYEGAGITPLLGDAAKPHSPIFRYPLADVKEAIGAMPETADGARRIRYTNPLTGGAAMPGIDCYMLAPGKGRDTRAYRTNANMVCLAVEGEGVSRVGEHVLRWGKNDIFSLPRGHWISHRADSADALLFQLTDREVLASLHYLREEFRD
jgi:gentisate 1,2-dioxygenase